MGFEAAIESAAGSSFADAQVTASQLVRQFGIWQERAGHAPVFIHHRGRAKLVLASMEQVRQWQAIGRSPGPGLPSVEALLNGFATPLLLLDHMGAIVAKNAAAESWMAPADAWLAPLQATIVDVARHRIAERVVVRGGADGNGTFEIALQPWLDHVLVRIDNASLGQQLQDRISALDAMQRAIDQVAPDVASALLTPRGYLSVPSPALAAMTGIALAATIDMRFVSLIDIASRVTVGDLIDETFRTGTPARAEAYLRVNRADPIAVSIGLAPIREAAAITALQVVIARQSPPALIHS
ncbi:MULTISPECIES: hypothetical protein [unclassified Sphingomonas]|uniref:hypothetical protein n=1 Tax=unclassified Sphingomonas TaxID=196159 RepID=UPI00082CD6B8|nr:MULTISPECIES: hypothetical protein [unclassified Sphingomonas]